jgi:DeoR/GlpR family transcriptional regulator of sugar metabolism
MFETALERREEILNRVLTRGHVAVKTLAPDLGVSEATVRRDLRLLADEGRVELTYGGATTPREPDFSLDSRARRNVEAKRIIGKLAADLVRDGDMLYVDSGTTCFEMRHHLSRRKGLSVIVSSTRLAMELGGNSASSVILLGGQYRAERMETVGPLAAAAIDSLRGYAAFIGADGLDPEFGLSATDIHVADLYRHVLKNARESILLADHTKFARSSVFRICGWEAITRVVTDRVPDREWSMFLADAGVQVICPEPSASRVP